MEYIEICKNDYNVFHELANAYYREGEDEKTPQDEIDALNPLRSADYCGYLVDMIRHTKKCHPVFPNGTVAAL